MRHLSKRSLNYFISPKLILLFILASTLFFACSPKKELVMEKWFENPNGQSELATTMREMYDAMKVMQFDIENGKKVRNVPDFEHMLTDSTTDPDLERNIFDPFAKAWLSQMESMKTSSKKEQRKNYNGIVNTCISCHSQLCPGPIARINHLVLE